MYYTGERTFQDMKRWNPLIGKTFYERNPKNDKEIRTYYMSWNGFANKIVPQISNCGRYLKSKDRLVVKLIMYFSVQEVEASI